MTEDDIEHKRSHENDFSRFVELAAAEVGFEGAHCRRVWEPALDDPETGETIPGEWRYEMRHSQTKQIFWFDDEIGGMFLDGNELERSAMAELVRAELDSWQGDRR